MEGSSGSQGDDTPGWTFRGEPLARLVDRQRRENANLQNALRTRAVIEQAKGIIVAQTGTDPATAFQRLVTYSQRTNRKLVQVAAEIIAGTVAVPARDGSATPEERGGNVVSRPDPAMVLSAAAFIAAPNLNELLDAVMQHVHRLGVTAGLLALAEPDGALRIVGHHGIRMHEVSAWQRIPPGTGLPITAAAREREAVWLRNRSELDEAFPEARRFPGERQACAALPIELEGRLVGVLALDWDADDELADATRRTLLTVAQQCAGPVAQLLRSHDDPLTNLDFEPAHARWFWGFLDVQPIPHVVLEARVEQDVIVDLDVVFANAHARSITALSTGDHLLEYFPRLVDRGLVQHATEVLRTGAVHHTELVVVPLDRGSVQTFRNLTISRVGTLLVVSWRSPG